MDKNKTKMYKKIIKLAGTEIEEYPISINVTVINEIVISNKFPFGKPNFKYNIGYKDNKEIRPLCILFQEMSIYKR